MMQYIIIGILFIGALIYVGLRFYKSFFSKDKACGGNCGCSAADMKRIERQIEDKIRMENK